MHQILNIIDIIEHNQTIQIIKNIYFIIWLVRFHKQYIYIYIFSMSRILTSDRLYSQFPNDSKLNRKVSLKTQYIALFSILINKQTR
jgi:hypothetical protein